MQKKCFQKKIATYVAAMVFLALGFPCQTPGQQEASTAGIGRDEPENTIVLPQFCGPASVGGQVKSDQEKRGAAYRFEGFSRSMQPYYVFKQQMNDRHGLAFGADYV